MGLVTMLGATDSQYKLYNITFKEDDKRTVLEPTVPDSVADDEDRVTTRICFSDSIEGCLSSLAPMNRDLKKGAMLIVRSVDRSRLDKKCLFDYNWLFQQNKVRDALFTHEFWYTSRVAVSREVYRIVDFNYDYCINRPIVDMCALIELSMKYTNLPLYKIAMDQEDCFRIVSKYLCDHGDYVLYDDYWEDISKFPYAKAIRIYNLELEKVC